MSPFQQNGQETGGRYLQFAARRCMPSAVNCWLLLFHPSASSPSFYSAVLLFNHSFVPHSARVSAASSGRTARPAVSVRRVLTLLLSASPRPAAVCAWPVTGGCIPRAAMMEESARCVCRGGVRWWHRRRTGTPTVTARRACPRQTARGRSQSRPRPAAAVPAADICCVRAVEMDAVGPSQHTAADTLRDPHDVDTLVKL